MIVAGDEIKNMSGEVNAPDLSIIIVNWNGARVLENCLESIDRNRAGLKLEIILVDNNSSDESLLLVKEKYPWVRLLKNCSNLGFARATNKGLRLATSPYLLLLNNDTEVMPGALPALLSYLKKNGEVGAVGAMAVNPDGSPQLSYGFFPTFYTLLVRYLLCHETPQDAIFLKQINLFQPGITDKAMKLGCVPEQCEYPEDVDYVSGACLMTRREVLEKVGYLDEDFFAYFEDTDWCLRVKQAGLKVVFCPYGRIIHHVSTSFKATGQKESFFLRSMLIYVTKHFGREVAVEARRWLEKIFRNKEIYFNRLACQNGNSYYQDVADYYRALTRVLKEGEETCG